MQGVGYPEFGEVIVDLAKRLIRSSAEPAKSSFVFRGCCHISSSPSVNETECVPDLVCEIPALFDVFFLVEKVIARGGTEQHSSPDCIGAIPRDEIERIRRVPQ